MRIARSTHHWPVMLLGGLFSLLWGVRERSWPLHDWVEISGDVLLGIGIGYLWSHAYRQSITDDGTGLYNRRFIWHRLQGRVNQAKGSGQPASLIVIDLDNFKACNDNYGHLMGDLVLKTVADCLRKTVRGSDLVGRWGGEEFVIVLPATDPVRAASVAERVRSQVEALEIGAEKVRVTVSVGVAMYPEHAADSEGLLHAADRALYQAKIGKNRIVMAGPAL